MGKRGGGGAQKDIHNTFLNEKRKLQMIYAV
jgi:hypothetical protein